MIRVLLSTAAFLTGCAGVRDLTLGAWRRVPIPVRALALAQEGGLWVADLIPF